MAGKQRSTKQFSTRQLLAKIPSYPCLYRHTVNGNYYGIKKIAGKRKEHSLDTADRKLAERKLKDWLNDLDRIDAGAAKTTFKELLEKFKQMRKGKARHTVATDTAIIKKIKKEWPEGIHARVADIKSSQLNQWLSAWASPQSRVIESRKFLEIQIEEMKRKFADGKIPLPSFWGGFCVVPCEFEFWQGGANRVHDRFLYSHLSDHSWKIERLAP